jgi:MFS family permease
VRSHGAATSSREVATIPSRTAWVPPAAVLLGVGWGSNQFTPMLLVYRRALGLGTGTLEAMFGIYALGLIPGLLLAGPLSDARGRRNVVLAAAGLSLLASVMLVAGAHIVALLFAGRLMAGLSSGAVFAAGTAWLRETSLPPVGTASRDRAVRRAVIAMTAGFGLGPLVAGMLAQWAPAPTIAPYLPHIALMAGVLVPLSKVPETVASGSGRAVRLSVPGARSPRFRRVVAPMAPWVFAAPAIAFALLPSVVGTDRAADAIAVAAVVTTLTALAGVLVQPLARRLEAHAASNRAGITGLLVLSGGLVLGAATAQAQQAWLLVPCAIVLGCAYGLCLVAGLIEVQRIAREGEVASLTAVYYALTYLGFAVPYLLALAAHLASYPVLLLITAALALATAATVARRSAQHPEPHTLREELDVPVPDDREPGRPWKPYPSRSNPRRRPVAGRAQAAAMAASSTSEAMPRPTTGSRNPMAIQAMGAALVSRYPIQTASPVIASPKWPSIIGGGRPAERLRVRRISPWAIQRASR